MMTIHNVERNENFVIGIVHLKTLLLNICFKSGTSLLYFSWFPVFRPAKTFVLGMSF